MSIGTKIQAALKARGVSQKELAERLGVTHVQIGKYIRGQVTPKPGQLYKIADALDISPLFFGLLPEKITRDGDLAGYLMEGIRCGFCSLLAEPDGTLTLIPAEQGELKGGPMIFDQDVLHRVAVWNLDRTEENAARAMLNDRELDLM